MMITKNTIELQPVLDSRKSFYKKAYVIEENGGKYLASYGTIVAKIDKDGAHVLGTYSTTTLRHIKDFLYQNGFKVGTKKEIEDMYLTEKY